MINFRRKSDYNYETELFDNRIKTYNELLSLFSSLFNNKRLLYHRSTNQFVNEIWNRKMRCIIYLVYISWKVTRYNRESLMQTMVQSGCSPATDASRIIFISLWLDKNELPISQVCQKDYTIQQNASGIFLSSQWLENGWGFVRF